MTPKTPASVEVFNWDCRRQIQSGEGGTIASVVEVYEVTALGVKVVGSAVTVLSNPAVDQTGYIISASLGGGTVGVKHLMTAEYLTTQGERLYHTFSLDCRAVVVG